MSKTVQEIQALLAEQRRIKEELKIREDDKFIALRLSGIANGQAGKGRKLSNETKEKISAAGKGVPKSEETKKKLSESSKGKVVTTETREKISLANKGRIAPNKGKSTSEETKEKLRKINTGKSMSEETKAKIRETYARKREAAKQTTQPRKESNDTTIQTSRSRNKDTKGLR